MKYNIFVVYGGKSVEHEVSLKSASAIINSIDRDKYQVYPVYINKKGSWVTGPEQVDRIEDPQDLIMDTNLSVAKSLALFMEELDRRENVLIFPAVHGTNGEDGTIQGMLELLDLPYVGCGVMASSIGMDKVICKDLFRTHQLPQADYLSFHKADWRQDKQAILSDIEEAIGYPVYVKPANSGSSVGISRVGSREEIVEAVDLALKYDRKVLVEKELLAREMQVSVIGNHSPMVSLPGEFIMERPFFDYNAKYIDGTIVPVVPANLDEDTRERVRALAVDVYKVLNCTGLTRVDIFVDKDNNIFVNEANTMPGFTPVSMTPVLWEATDGTSYTELVEKLISYGLELYKDKEEILNMR